PQWYEHIKAEADDILAQPPSHYEIPDGRRLLGVSRQVKERVRTLMFIHLVEGGDQYVDRVWAEINAVCQFKDWNPSHFLDTAEMTYAVAMSYDWLYDRWSDNQKQAMCDAIITLGLEPGMQVYGGNPVGSRWDLNTNNWNQVCNGGLSIGALAIADEAPDIAKNILAEAIKSIPRPMNHYAPDGAGTEGVTYWDYGSRYNILYLSALQTALGTDFNLSQIPGFKESGQYQMYISGPTCWSYDFADCGLRQMGTPMHFWMGKTFSMPQYSWFRYNELAFYNQDARVLDFLWFDDSGINFDPSTLALDKHFRGAEVASMRSSWTDKNALAIGIQAGSNANLGSHRHIDLGTFVLDALSERWIMDSGTERETYLRHQNKREKWEFYRVRTEGHNIPTLNPGEDGGQKLDAVAPITSFESTPEGATATLDLSDAYAEHARSATRTFEMQNRNTVMITDTLKARDHLDYWWFLHTTADISLDLSLREATLTQNDKQFLIKIEDGPSLAEFDIMDAVPLSTSPNPKQTPNDNVKKLVI
ncbi:MAG: heparinase II/III family protein, partial [Candidatus Latescibacteria bacterium]|nr:heparinase II/III family protein [Candidatus Latescibacterota bacterium]